MNDMVALQAVIQENRQRQERARDLNIRAGEDVFKIMSRSEWREWLTERLNGARRAMEIADINTLYLPEFDIELVAKVLADNPDTITIESVELAIEYGKEYYGGTYARTDVEEEFARNAQSEAVTLPGGRSVEIRCSGHSAKTFTELVEKLEHSRIERCWSEARSQNETSWTTDSNKVIEWLAKVGDEVEITRTDNGQGEPIIGFIGLKRYSGYQEWMLFVADTKEKAQEETQKALEVLLQASVKESLVVPKEEPWQKSGYWNWELTDLGRALQSRFETLVKEHAEGLTSGNIEEKITALKSAIEAVKAEIGGEHESTKTIVEEMKTSLEGKIDSLEDKDFVKSEIEEAQTLIREAEENLASGSYANAKAKSEKVEAVWKQAQDRIAQRQARVEKGEILINFEAWHRRGGMSGNGDGWVIRPDGSLREHDTNDVRRYKSDGNYCWSYVSEDELALKWSCGTMRDVAGSSEFLVVKKPVKGLTQAQRETVRRIELEDIGTTENSFGLDPEAAERQTKLVAEAAQSFTSCPACGEAIVIDENFYRSLTGEYGMHICQDDRKISRLVDYNKPFSQDTEGREAQVIASKRVSNGLIEALAYEKWGGWNLNLRWRKMTEDELAEAEHMEEATQGNGSFTEAGGRHFKCGCGCQTRVTKSEWKDYQAGQPLEIHCSVCGADGVVQKADDAEEKSESKNGGLDVEALKKAWGCK